MEVDLLLVIQKVDSIYQKQVCESEADGVFNMEIKELTSLCESHMETPLYIEVIL